MSTEPQRTTTELELEALKRKYEVLEAICSGSQEKLTPDQG